VERAEVVYVSGNELVVKMENGEVRHLTVPDGVTATVDGRQVTVRDLKPGMKLQRTVTTTTTPKTVTTVRTVSGRVVSVIPPLTLILSFPDGSPNKQYQIPKDQVFVVDGERKTAFDLRPGMPVSATVVTSGPVTETNVSRTVTGTTPAPPPPARPVTPPPQPVLLIEVTVPAPPPVAVAAPPPAPAPPARAPEPAPTQLPKTGSPLPLIGLLGVLMVGASLGLRVWRG
jgi:LPXTG-motif cell wall-anchored protein